MLKLVRAIVSRLVYRLRSRAVVELENLALRHQLYVLRRQRPVDCIHDARKEGIVEGSGGYSRIT
jgi:hypothetical protein